MGLFGGFKAKFTRNSTTKVKPQEVVCLKYHIHSEFDAPEASFPVANNIKKNEVIKRNSKTRGRERKPLTKSAIFTDSSDTSNTTLSSPVVQKSQSLVNLNGNAEYDHPDSIAFDFPGNSKSTVSNTTFARKTEEHNGVVAETIAVVTNNHLVSTNNHVNTEKKEKTKSTFSNTTFGRKTEEHNGVVAETIAVVTNNHLVSTNNHVKTEKKEKTILKTFSAYNEPEYNATQQDQDLQSDKSTLIFMTQHSSELTEKDAENGEENFEVNFSNRAFKIPRNNLRQDSIEEEDYADGNFNINITSKSYDDDDFKVNVVKHDYNRSYSAYSEDEKSYHEEELLEFTKMGFSSQAASIFFGQDIEPVQPRPRRILLKKEDEDDRRSSGADC